MRPDAASRDQIFLAVLAAASTYLVIGDFGVRLANTSTDDGLVAYAYLYRYPELFAQDAHMLNWGRAALASMLNWLPAVLFKYADVPPEIFYWTFTFLQNILLVLAMYQLAMVMMGSRESALIAALLTLAFRPHWWNLGLFADLNWMPYGAWLALPFLVFAGGLALQLRLGATAIALLIGGLAHPILGVFAAAMIATYWLLVLVREGKTREMGVPLVVIALSSAAFLLPVMLVKLAIEEVPTSELLPSVLRNGHAIPWANPDCDYCMPLFVRGIVGIPVIAALALVAAARAATHPRLRMFLVACCMVTLTAFLAHVAAYFAQNAALLRIISTRATILLLVFAVPPLAWLAWRVFSQRESLVARFAAGYMVVWPSPMALLAGLLLLPKHDDREQLPAPSSALLRRGRQLGAALLALVLLRYVPGIGAWIDSNVVTRLIDGSYVAPLFGFPSSRVHASLVLYICVILIWDRWRSTRHPTETSLAFAMAVPLTAYALASSYQNGVSATSGEARAYYEVQAWARSSTASRATFIVGGISVYEGWRNFSRRARISVGGCGYYVCSKAARDEASKASEFIARFGNPYGPVVSSQGMAAFARTYGGDYAVRRKTWAPLDFPIAFQNDAYIVYDLR